MFVRSALCLLILSAASPALAQDIELLPGAPDPVERPPREQLFISPAGEPFRAPPGQPYPVGTWFAKADADRDGAVTKAEFAADHLAFFKTLDKDDDGIVDGFEAAAYEKEIAPEVSPRESRGMGRPMRPKKQGGFLGFGGKVVQPLGAGRQGAGVYGLLNEPLPIRAADSDFDYKVTTPEVEAAAARRFGLLDRNGDGRLTRDELPKTPFQALLERAPPQPSAPSAIP